MVREWAWGCEWSDACWYSGQHITRQKSQKFKIHWKMSLTIHWAILVQIHWTSDNPLENTTRTWSIVGACHWKSTMISEVFISGVQDFVPTRSSTSLARRWRTCSTCATAGRACTCQSTYIFSPGSLFTYYRLYAVQQFLLLVPSDSCIW